MSLDLCTVHVHVGFSRYPVFKALFLRPSVSQTTRAVPVIFKNTAEKYRFILKHRSVHGRMSRGASSSYMLVANIHIYSTGSEVPIYFKTQIRARTHVPRCPQVGEVLLRSTATDLDVRPRAGRGTETTTAWSALARSAAQCAEQCPPDLRGRRRRPVFEYFIIRKMR